MRSQTVWHSGQRYDCSHCSLHYISSSSSVRITCTVHGNAQEGCGYVEESVEVVGMYCQEQKSLGWEHYSCLGYLLLWVYLVDLEVDLEKEVMVKTT